MFKATRNIKHNGTFYTAGDLIDVAGTAAKRLLSLEAIEQVEEPKDEAIKETAPKDELKDEAIVEKPKKEAPKRTRKTK
jgi:hypothetical protein